MTISAAAGNAPRVHILGAACALGAPHAGSAHAPSALRSAQLMRSLIAAGVDAQWVDTLHPVADTFSIKVCKNGGIRESLRIIELARCHGIDILFNSMLEEGI